MEADPNQEDGGGGGSAGSAERVVVNSSWAEQLLDVNAQQMVIGGNDYGGGSAQASSSQRDGQEDHERSSSSLPVQSSDYLAVGGVPPPTTTTMTMMMQNDQQNQQQQPALLLLSEREQQQTNLNNDALLFGGGGIRTVAGKGGGKGGGKKKRKGSKTSKKGRSAGKSSSKAGKAEADSATATSVDATADSSNKQQRPKQFKRRGSSSSLQGGSKRGSTGSLSGTGTGAASATRTASLKLKQVPTVPVDDTEPDRLVNPLTIPPPISHDPGGNSILNRNFAVRSHDLWPVLQLSFARPDTYPISYLARLLGYRVPFGAAAAAAAAATSGKLNDVGGGAVPWDENLMRTLRTSRLRDDEATGVYKVPPFGSFADNVWKKKNYNAFQLEDYEDDDRVLGDTRDPLYTALCNPIPTPPRRGSVPITPVQLSKFLPSIPRLLLPVLECACGEMGILQPQRQGEHGDGTAERMNIKPSWTMSSLHAYRQANPELIFPAKILDPTVCGICLFRNGEPIGVVLYTFEWYSAATTAPPAGGGDGSGDGTVGGSTSSSIHSQIHQQQGYELIMVFRDVLEGQKGESLMKTPPPSSSREQEGLALTLVALALEHAKLCHVGYALFHLTTVAEQNSFIHRQAWLQQFFRMRRQRHVTIPIQQQQKQQQFSNSMNNTETAAPVICSNEDKPDDDHSSSMKEDNEERGEARVPTATTDIKKGVDKGIPGSEEKPGAENPSVPTLNKGGDVSTTLVCDLHAVSYQYAFLMFLESEREKDSSRPDQSLATAESGGDDDGDDEANNNNVVVAPRRWLARLPNVDDAKLALGTASSAVHSRTKKNVARKPSQFFTGAPMGTRPTVLQLRAKLLSPGNKRQQLETPPPSTMTQDQPQLQHDGTGEPQLKSRDREIDQTNYYFSGVEMYKYGDSEDEEGKPIEIPKLHDLLQLDLLRDFELPLHLQKQSQQLTASSAVTNTVDESAIVRELTKKQNELQSLEEGIEPLAHKLMDKIIEQRVEFENSSDSKKKVDEQAILDQYKRTLERRKEQDLAWQKQLEQDMDAVCDVCNEGEVIPGNQIIFCEACNVAVHQMCYGVDRIPAGDYYCKACRYLGRDNASLTRKTGIRLVASPLPICCELCPRKQGAFIRTDSSGSNNEEDKSFGKWVHAVCAKWQGLTYVGAHDGTPDILEDVTELKYTFRRLGIKCSLCLGERGGMNQCRHPGCQNWIHITCARAVGTCEVIHGEDVRGPIADNPWSLMCPQHSNIKLENIPKDAISIDSLIQSAKEFPPEPPLPLTPMAPKPFNIATGEERNRLLMNKAYEAELLLELTEKKLFGVKCEVCDIEVDHKNRSRCNKCSCICCLDCSLKEIDGTDANFRCAKCLFKIQKEKAHEDFETPQCIACYQKGGWLRKAYAKPMKSWKGRKGYAKSLFARQLWVHSACAFWAPGLVLDPETGQVDCSNVVMATGRGLVQSDSQCFLCGQSGGLKVKCAHEGGCAYCIDSKLTDAVFHVTCARQAGFEVNVDDRGSVLFYAKCYRHGGNEFNLRAKLEDMIEIEKRRAGKAFTKEDAPMTFSHASRLLHSSIGCLRLLGWAWRWSELWVDYNSSWEPLLEPGESEENMTNEELKIVESTRESRCDDARKCRLAAFGAALRNRDYDQDGDFDRESFDRALRSVLSTESLVGPLQQNEIDFYVRWLTLAYWSKSRHLGFGIDKIQVNSESPHCVHKEDRSPKHVLGRRHLPGSNKTSEISVTDLDDFMRTEVMTDEFLSSLRTPRKKTPSKAGGHSNSPRATNKKRGRGRPPTKKAVLPNKKRGPGRPKKTAVEPSGAISSSSTTTTTTSDTAVAEVAVITKKHAGRPSKKNKRKAEETLPEVAETTNTSLQQPSQKKKRRGRPGRPKKIQQEIIPQKQETAQPSKHTVTQVVKKRRGRPPRKKTKHQKSIPVPEPARDEPSQLSRPRPKAGAMRDLASSDDEQSESLSEEVGTEALDADGSKQLDVSQPRTPRRKRRRKQEVTPIDRRALGIATRYDVVKRRRRQPADRLAVSFGGKSYGDDDFHVDAYASDGEVPEEAGGETNESISNQGPEEQDSRSAGSKASSGPVAEVEAPQAETAPVAKRRRGRPTKKRVAEE